jgi:hypothetical protein
MWSCDTCGRPNHRNPLICETCGAAAPGADADQVTLALQRDLAMESHFRGLAFWYRLGAVLLGVSVLGLLGMFGFVGRHELGMVTQMSPGASLIAGALGWIAMVMLVAVVGSYVLGHYLARFSNGARLAAGILTIVSLAFGLLKFVLTCFAYSKIGDLYAGDVYYDMRPSLAGPIVSLLLTTIWSLAIIFTLFSGRAAAVCAPTYRTIVARTAQMKASMVKTPFFVIPLVVSILAALFVLRIVMLTRGYSSTY